ncbi:MAG: DUF2752 domain-containing protein [Armatimonadetes bacterium]|nr:DUF2752 domain-containing protein [Armatimonadota bacterium]
MAQQSRISTAFAFPHKARLLPSGFAALFLSLSLVLPPAGLPVNLCLFKWITGVPCPGCGLTRSVTCLSHGHFAAAFHFHPFGIVAYLVLAGLLFAPFAPAGIYSACASWFRSRKLGLAFTVVFVAYAVLRIWAVATGQWQNIW